METQKKIGIVKELKVMWNVFIDIARIDKDKHGIEQFMRAKDRIHQILADGESEAVEGGLCPRGEAQHLPFADSTGD